MIDRVPQGLLVPHQIKWRNSPSTNEQGRLGMIHEFVDWKFNIDLRLNIGSL